MKINCGPTPQERFLAKQDWHRWFAWKPVRIGSGDCRWLETIERRGHYSSSWYDEYWYWEYRPLKREGE